MLLYNCTILIVLLVWNVSAASMHVQVPSARLILAESTIATAARITKHIRQQLKEIKADNKIAIVQNTKYTNGLIVPSYYLARQCI